MVITEVHERVAELLSAEGQRYTAERRTIVESLATADRPLTVESLREVSPEIPISSAYRNLSVLERVGALEKIRSEDDHARFELSEELTDHHHHHMVCTGCGVVEDFTVPSSLERSLVERLTEVAEARGFEGVGHRLDLVGVCPDCV